MPSVTPRRLDAPAAPRPGLRGAVPVPAPAAPPAAPAHRSTSPARPIDERIIDYYLALLPGVIPRHARARLHLVATHDGSARPLTAKLLERPRRPGAIRALIPDRGRCHLVPYTTTTARARPRPRARHPALRRRSATAPARNEDRLPAALRRGGCRRIRSAARTSATSTSVVDALARAARREARRCSEAIVKLNEGVSGRGNALVDLAGLPAPGAPDERAELARASRGDGVRARRRCQLDAYLGRLAADGRHRRGAHHRDGAAEPERPAPRDAARRGRAAVDARPAARRPERPELSRLPLPGRLRLRPRDHRRRPRRSAARLAREGRPRAASPSTSWSSATPAGTWTPYAIELNLRKGGTTHPFLTLQFLTDGAYDPATALFTAPSGREKHLVASDHLESDALRGLTVDDLFDIAVRHRLHFDQARQTGVVFHMMSALAELGRIGLTAVGDSRAAGRGHLPPGRAGPARGGEPAAGSAAACGMRSSDLAQPGNGPCRDRTYDLGIKSPLLYQLS